MSDSLPGSFPVVHDACMWCGVALKGKRYHAGPITTCCMGHMTMWMAVPLAPLLARLELLESQVKSLQMAAPKGIPT